jgi:hypothetical protein
MGRMLSTGGTGVDGTGGCDDVLLGHELVSGGVCGS